jgi:hypothetical protein
MVKLMLRVYLDAICFYFLTFSMVNMQSSFCIFRSESLWISLAFHVSVAGAGVKLVFSA